MSATTLAERLAKQTTSSEAFDWRGMRDEIVEEHDRSTTTADRVICLRLYKIVMDAAEKQVSAELLETFRTAREQDYNRMLASEALIGRTDGNVDSVKLLEATRREIAAGRMPASAKLHEIATIGAGFIGSPPKQKASFFKKLFSGNSD